MRQAVGPRRRTARPAGRYAGWPVREGRLKRWPRDRDSHGWIASAARRGLARPPERLQWRVRSAAPRRSPREVSRGRPPRALDLWGAARGHPAPRRGGQRNLRPASARLGRRHHRGFIAAVHLLRPAGRGPPGRAVRRQAHLQHRNRAPLSAEPGARQPRRHGGRHRASRRPTRLSEAGVSRGDPEEPGGRGAVCRLSGRAAAPRPRL